MLSLRIRQLFLRFHAGLVVIAAGLAALGGDLWARYLLLLAVLLLHELAHAITGLALGGHRVVVTIWPWGGVAHVPRFSGRRGAAVALAGPASNLVAAGVLAFFGPSLTLDLGAAPLLDLLLTANLLMGCGNLIPLPPLDGGRAIRFLREETTSSQGGVS